MWGNPMFDLRSGTKAMTEADGRNIRYTLESCAAREPEGQRYK